MARARVRRGSVHSRKGASMTITNAVYRIQDADGRGPYKPGWSHVWQERRCLIDGSKHPTFMDEFPGIVDRINVRFAVAGGDFGCGFRTMEQLERWFDEAEIAKLRSFGYGIVRLTPDEILAESDKQLVFWSRKPLKRVARAA